MKMAYLVKMANVTKTLASYTNYFHYLLWLFGAACTPPLSFCLFNLLTIIVKCLLTNIVVVVVNG